MERRRLYIQLDMGVSPLQMHHRGHNCGWTQEVLSLSAMIPLHWRQNNTKGDEYNSTYTNPSYNQCDILYTCWACAASLSRDFLLAAVSLNFFQWSWRVAIRWLMVFEDSCPPDFSFAPSLHTLSKCGCRPKKYTNNNQIYEYMNTNITLKF